MRGACPVTLDNETSAPAARRGVEALEHLKQHRRTQGGEPPAKDRTAVRLAVSRGERPRRRRVRKRVRTQHETNADQCDAGSRTARRDCRWPDALRHRYRTTV